MDNEARRAQLLDDLLGLQAAGLIADEEAAELDRCNALAGEYDRPALDSRLRQMIRRREARDGFRAWAVKLRKPAAFPHIADNRADFLRSDPFCLYVGRLAG